MTRANINILLSDGKKIKCVADSSAAPEQGYIVEELILPLLKLNHAGDELWLLHHHCSIDEQRVNADYRYEINLMTKRVSFYEEHYDYGKDRFDRGEDITERYDNYLTMIKN
jgi:hypothetical protein